MADEEASVKLALERLRAIVQAHSVRATPDAQSLQVDMLETLEDLRRDAGLQTAAEISVGRKPNEEDRAQHRDAQQANGSHAADGNRLDDPGTDGAAAEDDHDMYDSGSNGIPNAPPKLARNTSDCNGGVLPHVWLEDLRPHFDMLEQCLDQEEAQSPGGAVTQQTDDDNDDSGGEGSGEDLKPPPPPPLLKMATPFPEQMEISLREAHHLVLVVHGIGKHHDFKDASMSWDGSYGELSGGFYDFKSKFYETLGPDGPLKDLPMMINFESIEWHEPLRESCNVEEVLKEAAPEGIASLREFVTEAMTDGLLYWSQRYGQSIIDSVAWQLNEKYKSFKETHPGFTGPVSIFAHSLGSIIIFDLLSRCRKDIRTPRLDFDVNVFFLAGSPLAYMHLCRGDLFDDGGTYIPSYFLPESVRVVNLFHVNDPVAWRLGPLLVEKKLNQERQDEPQQQQQQEGGQEGAKAQPEGEEKRKQIREQVEATGVTVTLPHASEVDSLGLEDILLKFAKLFHFTPDDATRSSDMHLRPIDFGLPTSRYERVVELASATSAHSSYWGNPSLALGVIMALCEPLMPILLLYKERGISASVKPRRMTLSHTQPALAIEPVMEEGPVKGFWAQRFCLLQDDGLFLFDKDIREAAGSKQGSIPLDRCQIRVKALAKDKKEGKPSSPRAASSSSSVASLWSSASSLPSNRSVGSEDDAAHAGNSGVPSPLPSPSPTISTMQCPSEAFMLVVRDSSAKGTVTYDIVAKTQRSAQWWVDGIQAAQQAYLYSQGNLEQEHRRPRRHSMSTILSGGDASSTSGRPRNMSIASAPGSARDASPSVHTEGEPHGDADGVAAATTAHGRERSSTEHQHQGSSISSSSSSSSSDDGGAALTDDATLDGEDPVEGIDRAQAQDPGSGREGEELDQAEDEEEDEDEEPPSDLFDLVRYGNLVVNVSTQWTGKSTKWFALRKGADALNCFEREPKAQPIRQLDLNAVHLVQGSRTQRLLRLIYTGGGAMNIRFTRDGVFERWFKRLNQLCVHANFEDLTMSQGSFRLPRSPLSDDDLAAAEDVELSVAVTGYVICREPGSTSSYASYTINVIFGKKGHEGAHVVRRYNEFKHFSKELAKELDVRFGPDAVQNLPVLPSSTLLPTLRPSYLNRQVQKLHGYLCSLSKIEEVQGCSAWYAFLLRSHESDASKSRQRTSSGTLPQRAASSTASRYKSIDTGGGDAKYDQ